MKHKMTKVIAAGMVSILMIGTTVQAASSDGVFSLAVGSEAILAGEDANSGQEVIRREIAAEHIFGVGAAEEEAKESNELYISYLQDSVKPVEEESEVVEGATAEDEMTEEQKAVAEQIKAINGVEETPKVNGVLAAGVALDATETETVSLEDLQEETDDTEEEIGGSAFGYTNLGIANVTDNLNIRESADDNSKIVGKLTKDAACEILGIEENKAHIASGSVEGYVSIDYLYMGAQAVEYANSVVKEMATVSGNGLKVRTAPGEDSEVINMVSYGEELEVVQVLDGWVQVKYDEQDAYVSADYVSVGKNLKTALNISEFLYGEGVSDVRMGMVDYGKQFLGNPYVWGGTSLTKGTDCSGYTMGIYKHYGISLPRTSRAQATVGKAVNAETIRPGDLVFYSKGGRINHVAMYIGGGQVIHASSPKYGIRITSMYYRTPTAMRTYLGD